MPFRVLSALHVFTLFILTSKSMRCYYYLHFTVEETEAQLFAQGLNNAKKLRVTKVKAREVGRIGSGWGCNWKHLGSPCTPADQKGSSQPHPHSPCSNQDQTWIRFEI